MDRVRFGRALGYGARHAAKTLVAAAEAASAEPRRAGGTAAATDTPRPTPEQRSRPVSTGRVEPAAASARSAAPRAAAVRAQASQTGKSMVSSVKRFSGAVMLQVIGTFFAVFAATFGNGAWRLRAAIHEPASSPQAHKFYAVLILCVVFAYFAISSFLRARKLENA